jgi:hypothetical protein
MPMSGSEENIMLQCTRFWSTQYTIIELYSIFLSLIVSMRFIRSIRPIYRLRSRFDLDLFFFYFFFYLGV